MNAIALLHYSRNCEAPMLFALEGMCFFDAIADESRARLEVEFVNLSFSANESTLTGCFFVCQSSFAFYN